MPTMRLNRVYRVKNIYPESGYYDRRNAFEGELVVCKSHEHQFNYPSFNPDQPETLLHAKVEICSGFWRGQEILLTYFTAELSNTTMCRCEAYPFQHKRGGGRCHS